jgi:glycosyltransferase involved in cell wall biosynthesis
LRKKRILWCGEASYLSTGYSVYQKEVLSRLHATGKYELAELAAFGDISEPAQRWRTLPWKFYPVQPARGDRAGWEQYNQNALYRFGSWRFEATCLDFHPDVVLSIRDFWMDEFIERSPFRPFYSWLLMPTVDAAPQNRQWLATYANADGVFTYSDWGLEVLREQAGDRIRLLGSAPPGADAALFTPVQDRKAHRESLGLDPDALIVGTVMRNQRRKLYPDLIDAFALFLRENPDLAQRTYLYLHTSYPDAWHIPELVRDSGIAHKILFTYICRACGAVFPSFFRDGRTACLACGQAKACLPNTHHGVGRDVLAKVLNAFDCYVQYANSEGFGMPQVEAALCGLPVFATDYSAMADVVRKVKGFPIKVERFLHEAETGCRRALPDNRDFARQLAGFLRLPASVRAKHGFAAHRAARQHYDYDHTAKLWEAAIDALPLREDWNSPPRLHRPAAAVPAGLTDEEAVQWGMVHVAGRPDLVNSYTALRMARDLALDMTPVNPSAVYFNDLSTLGLEQTWLSFNRQNAMTELLKLCEEKNAWERRRAAL